MKEALTVNELFSGIGSQRKALERLGVPHRVVGISEIDKYAIKSYEAIFGKTRNYGDISVADKLDYADFWTYSFPCQDISVSGKGAGINENTRSGLLYQVKRLLNVAKKHNELPKYLILENVKNLVGKKFKAQFDEWLIYLETLGFNNYWKVLNAKDYGIPQNRERVFVISIRKDVDKNGYEFPESFDNGLRLKDLLEDSVDEKYYLRDELQRRFRERFANIYSALETTGVHMTKQGKEIEGVTDVCGALMARDYKGFGNQRMTAVAELQQVGTLKGRVLPFDKMHDQAGRVYDAEGVAPTIAAHSGGHLEPKIFQNCPHYNSRIIEVDNLDFRIRKLTPKECWRLMGFDDGDFNKAESVNSNTQLYRQAGNSIVVDVLERMLKKLFLFDSSGKAESPKINLLAV